MKLSEPTFQQFRLHLWLRSHSILFEFKVSEAYSV